MKENSTFPLISVLMSTYKESVDYIEKSVESILNQTYRNLEFIIVIDDPLNYALINRITKYNDERIKLIINDRNIGLVSSLNKGLQYCKGDYIARMDADDISHIDRLEKEYNFLIKNDLDLVGTYFRLFSDNNEKNEVYQFPISNEACIRKL